MWIMLPYPYFPQFTIGIVTVEVDVIWGSESESGGNVIWGSDSGDLLT